MFDGHHRSGVCCLCRRRKRCATLLHSCIARPLDDDIMLTARCLHWHPATHKSTHELVRKPPFSHKWKSYQFSCFICCLFSPLFFIGSMSNVLIATYVAVSWWTRLFSHTVALVVAFCGISCIIIFCRFRCTYRCWQQWHYPPWVLGRILNGTKQ